MANSNDSSTGQFIDPMFAVIIAAAVNETLVNWVKDPTTLPANTMQCLIVIIGFGNILLSWFGYHKSVANKPIVGELRFIITVVLLPLYMFTIIIYQRPIEYLVWTYSTIFLLWSLWEVLKMLEYKDDPSSSKGNKKNIWFNWHNGLMFIAFLFSVSSIIRQSFREGEDAIHYYGVYQLCLIFFAILILRITKADENTFLGMIKLAFRNLAKGSNK